jgi:hypothetical protein
MAASAVNGVTIHLIPFLKPAVTLAPAGRNDPAAKGTFDLLTNKTRS